MQRPALHTLWLVGFAVFAAYGLWLGVLRPSEGHQFAADSGGPLAEQVICLIGDSGKGDTRTYWLSQRLVETGCSEIRILGDLIYPDGLTGPDDPQYRKNFAEPFAPALQAGLPFFLLQGNHDYNNGAPDAWRVIGDREPLLHYPAPYYAERRGGLCIVSLDSTMYEKLYKLPARLAQNRWLRDVRTSLRPDCAFSLLLAHHPFQSPGRHGSALPQLALFYEREIMGQFDLLVAGHDHILADVGPYRGTHQFISGVGSKVDYLTEEHTQTPYVEAHIGFIALSFTETGGALEADARFFVLRGKGPELRWQRRVKGRGWRVDS